MGVRSTLHAVVTESVGIYGTAPTCHLSALARLAGYARGQLDRAIAKDRSLVRVRAMRRSVYIFGHDLLPVALAATRREVLRTYEAPSHKLGVDYERMAARVERSLARGPLPASDIRAAVDPGGAIGDRFAILLGRMAAECRIVRAPATGGWRSDRLTWARWEDWLPDVDPAALDAEEARRRLARAYFGAYGPAGLDDLAWWAGWSKREALAAAEGLDPSTPGAAARRLTGVRLLPVWDVLMVAYRNRERLFPPEHAPFIYDRFGNATSVVLDEGRVAGVWDLGASDDPLAVSVAPLGRWPKRRWDAVGDEVERLGRMLGAREVSVVRRPAPVNLLRAPRNRFLSPLRAG